jgi:hypothetical protein
MRYSFSLANGVVEYANIYVQWTSFVGKIRKYLVKLSVMAVKTPRRWNTACLPNTA